MPDKGNARELACFERADNGINRGVPAPAIPGYLERTDRKIKVIVDDDRLCCLLLLARSPWRFSGFTNAATLLPELFMEVVCLYKKNLFFSDFPFRNKRLFPLSSSHSEQSFPFSEMSLIVHLLPYCGGMLPILPRAAETDDDVHNGQIITYLSMSC